jgi:cytochrome P450
VITIYTVGRLPTTAGCVRQAGVRQGVDAWFFRIAPASEIQQPPPLLCSGRKAFTCPLQVETEDEEWTEDFVGERDPSILHFLLASGDQISSKQLRDDLMTLLIAGHEVCEHGGRRLWS